jgi:tRNA threonylcarbamoyladenosine biosynthesis protein TsaB
MLTLGIDTAGEQGAVGLCHGSEGLSALNFVATLQHGEKLLPAIDTILHWGDVERDDLRLIAVSTGPGSFTGLRIGMATAKGLARALNVPLVGVPTMATYARAVSFWPGTVYAVLKDRRELVYWAGFQGGEQLTSEQTESIEGLLSRLQQEEEASLPLIIGPGVEPHRALIEARGGRWTVAPKALNRPSGLQVAWIGLATYQANGEDEVDTLEPIYAQPPLAQPAGPEAD